MSQQNRPDPQSSEDAARQSEQEALASFFGLLTGGGPSQPQSDEPSSTSETDTESSPANDRPKSSVQPSTDRKPARSAQSSSDAHTDNDVAVLQNILVGPELAEHRQRINVLENQVTELEEVGTELTEHRQRIDVLENQVTELKDQVHQAANIIEQLVPILENLLDAHSEQLKDTLCTELKEQVHEAIAPLSHSVKNLATQIESDRSFSIQISGVSPNG